MGTVRQPHIDSPGIELSIMTGTSRLSSAYWDDDEVGMEIIHNYVLHVSRELIEWKGDTKKVTSLPRYYRVQFIHESVREYLLDRALRAQSTSRNKTSKLKATPGWRKIARCTFNFVFTANTACDDVPSSLAGLLSLSSSSRDDTRFAAMCGTTFSPMLNQLTLVV
jgi:hypothetical protein